MIPRRSLKSSAGRWLLASCTVAVLAACSGNKPPPPSPLQANPASVPAGVAWSQKLPAEVNFPLQVATVGNEIVVADSRGNVQAMQAGSGSVLWQASVGKGISAGVGSDGTTAAVVTDRNELVALRGGKEQWRIPLDTRVYTAPLVAGGRVFVLGADRSVAAYDGGNGFRLWTQKARAADDGLVLRQGSLLTAAGGALLAGVSGRVVAILYTLMVQFGIDELQPAKGALRQGVIVDLHQRLVAALPGSRQRELRDATVQQLQRRFDVDTAQAARVRRAALALYDTLLPGAPAESRRELGWVSDLHEIGFLLSHHDHHRHAAYMLAHVGAPGFSQDQLRRLATLALGQRGGLRKVAELMADERGLWQLLCLRLAVIQCHDRGLSRGRGFTAQRLDDSRLFLDWPSGAAAPDLRLRFLLQEEAQAWQRQGALQLQLRD